MHRSVHPQFSRLFVRARNTSHPQGLSDHFTYDSALLQAILVYDERTL